MIEMLVIISILLIFGLKMSAWWLILPIGMYIIGMIWNAIS